MIGWLVGCASAPEPTLAWVSEASGRPSVAGVTVAAPPGATFPAEPDPRGTHLLLVAATEEPHVESLWLAPLGGGEGTLLHRSSRVRNPSWAPDGAWLAFESDANSFRDLYRIDRDGSDLVRLTDAEWGSFEPAVSPDGAWVAFGSSRHGNAEIYVMPASGGAARRITDHPRDDVQPRWAPDGRTLSWRTFRDGPPRVWLVGADGSNPRPLRSGSSGDLDHAWSPDGGRIAVASEGVLEVVGMDGGVASIDGAGPDEHPAWSPDGGWLAFTSSRGGRPDVWVARADGSEARQVSRDEVAAWLPRWIDY